MKTELEVKREYESYIEKSSPDFDAVWNKIESEIEKTPQIKVKNNRAFKGIVAVAACAVICIIGAGIANSPSLKAEDKMNAMDTAVESEDMAVNNEGTAFESEDSVFTTTTADMVVDQAPGDMPVNDNIADDEVSCDGIDKIEIEQVTKPAFLPESIETIQYSEIAVRFSSPVDIDLNYDFDEYFVEDEMLRKTEYILSVEVLDVEITEDSTLLYYLGVGDDYSQSGIESFIEVESASPYQMLRGSYYIIFLYEENGEYRLSFENAPQMEISHSGLVFHNGFLSLTDGSVYVLYPKEDVNEYFYDRMRFHWGSYSDIITPVVDKWRGLTE